MGGRPDLQFNTRSPNSRQPPRKTQVSPPAASSPALLRYRSAACHAMTVASPAQGMPKSAERLLPLQSAARCAAGIPAGHHRHRGNLAPSKSKHGGSMWVLRPSLVNIIYTYNFELPIHFKFDVPIDSQTWIWFNSAFNTPLLTSC